MIDSKQKKNQSKLLFCLKVIKENQSKLLFCLKVIKVLAQGLICNETESFQGLAYKNRKRFGRNYAIPKGKRIWQKTFSENASFRKDREADSGSRLSGLKI